MSYNTRRSTSNYGGPPQNPNMAQRRTTTNFVPGGQLVNTQQPLVQQQQKPQVLQQQRPPVQHFQQQAQPQQCPPPVQQQQQQQQQQPPPPTPYAPRIVKKEIEVPSNTPGTVLPIPGANPPAPESTEKLDDKTADDATSNSGAPKKRFFKTGNKVSKPEKLRRRNRQLSKILQPKNAVMILNELMSGCVYTVEEVPVKIDGAQFRATVAVEGNNFAGTGRTKNAAKNAAAEVALRHIIKSRKFAMSKKDEDGDEKMSIEEEGGEAPSLPWSHIASFAMYKLFSSWGEDIVSFTAKVNTKLSKTPTNDSTEEANAKPAKKLPPNPETMNPVMLLHQMYPNSVWIELEKLGNPPNTTFIFSVTVEGVTFKGAGSSKKAAKKVAAFAACAEILNVSYPPEVLQPQK